MEQQTNEQTQDEKPIEHTVSISNLCQFTILRMIEEATVPRGHFAGMVSLQEKMLEGKDWEAWKTSGIVQDYLVIRPWLLTVAELSLLRVVALQHDAFDLRGSLKKELDQLAKTIEETLKN